MKRWSTLGKVALFVIVVVVCGVVVVRYGLTTTTLLVVRHAEKSVDGQDPPLCGLGMQRAAALAHLVERLPVAAAYHTQRQRTRLTVQPLAQQADPDIPLVEVSTDEGAPGLIEHVFANHAGRTVVIAGHSETVPEIVQQLSNETVAAIGRYEYDNLYVVIVHQLSALRALRVPIRKVDVLELKYGAPSCEAAPADPTGDAGCDCGGQ